MKVCRFGPGTMVCSKTAQGRLDLQERPQLGPFLFSQSTQLNPPSSQTQGTPNDPNCECNRL